MFDDYLILGGAGLVGLQVCRRICRELAPRRIVVASLMEGEARAAVARLQREFDEVRFVAAWGNLFVPTDLADQHRSSSMADPATRRRLLETVFGPFDDAFRENHLVTMIVRHKPQVIVDCVNTATGLSYQDVFTGANLVRHWLGEDGFSRDGTPDLERFLLSQSVPQLIRHVRFLHRATTENDTRVYLKVGTTGTGGMGMNIPYTHSEDKPSKVLLAKTEAAFGHTGLLFLLARTPDAPIVKEVKPAAMIGYRAVTTKKVRDKHGNTHIVEPRVSTLSDGRLETRESTDGYPPLGELEVSVVDTGENGVFTRGEFAAITALGQMEYITPEEIARTVVHEIRGANTGRDVISALDSAVLDPSYKAGLVRSVALQDLAQAEEGSELPSIALGRLGPPELSKLLFEAWLLRDAFGTLGGVLRDDEGPRTPESISAIVEARLETNAVRRLAPSIGIPILNAAGTSILRGPRINVPEVRGHDSTVSLDDREQIDRWARKGWVDLRPSNMATWLERVAKMIDARIELRDEGSVAASIASYFPVGFEIGEVVAWIFNNEMGGYRIK